jgi:hypothetical protein
VLKVGLGLGDAVGGPLCDKSVVMNAYRQWRGAERRAGWFD